MYRRTDGYPAGYVFRATPPPAGLTGSTQGVDRTGVSRYLIGHTGDNYFQDDTLMMGGNYILSDTSDLRLNIYRNEREYKFENPRSYLRDTAGSEVFVTATGTTPSPTPTPNFLSGSGPGGLEETNYIFHYTDQYWGGVNSHLTLGFHDEPDNWFVSPGATAATTINGGPGTISNTEGEHRTLDWQFESLLGDHLLTTGFSLRQGEIHRTVYSLADWKDRDNTGVKTNDDVGKDRIFALYLQDRFNISDNVTAHIGMRNDWWKGYDGRTVLAANPDPIIYANRNQNTFSPKAVLVYKPSPVTSYRLGAGKAFRSPSLSDLYQTTQTTNTLTTSNPNLKPETTISWELGLDHTFMSGINLAATYFDNEMDDFIYRLDTGTVDSSGRAIATRANAAKAYSRGVELGLNGEVAMVNWYANYTYTKAKITENPAVPDSEGKFLQQIPEHMANIGADWKRNRLTLSGAVRYADDRWGTDQNLETVFDTYGAYGSYTLVEAKIAYQLTDRLKASLSLDNITDEEWFDFFPAPGRSWFAEISADLF